MIFDHIILEENDVILVHHNIGNLPSYDVDKHCSKIIEHFGSVFGDKVLLIPVREGPDWDFTVITIAPSITRSLLKKVAKSDEM